MNDTQNLSDGLQVLRPVYTDRLWLQKRVVKIRMGYVPILSGAGASPLKSMVSKFSVNVPAPANGSANDQ